MKPVVAGSNPVSHPNPSMGHALLPRRLFERRLMPGIFNRGFDRRWVVDRLGLRFVSGRRFGRWAFRLLDRCVFVGIVLRWVLDRRITPGCIDTGWHDRQIRLDGNRQYQGIYLANPVNRWPVGDAFRRPALASSGDTWSPFVGRLAILDARAAARCVRRTTVPEDFLPGSCP